MSNRNALAILDDGPYEMPDLVRMFATIPRDDLEGCWVSCVIDSLSTHDSELYGLSMALVTVNQRLRRSAAVPLKHRNGVRIRGVKKPRTPDPYLKLLHRTMMGMEPGEKLIVDRGRIHEDDLKLMARIVMKRRGMEGETRVRRLNAGHHSVMIGMRRNTRPKKKRA